MSPHFGLRIKLLVALVGAACAVSAFAQEKPTLNYAAPKAPASGVASTQSAPPVASAPAASIYAPSASSSATPSSQPSTTSSQPSSESASVARSQETETTQTAKHAHSKTVSHKRNARHHVSTGATVVKDASEDGDQHYAAPQLNEVTVSDRDLNQFIFPSAVSQVIMPAGTPASKPIYLADNTQVLLQFQKGYDKSIQLIAELQTGKVYKLYLMPRPVNGITYSVDGARDDAPKQQLQQYTKKGADAQDDQPSPHGDDIELLKRVVAGAVPDDFQPITLPKPTRFDKFTVVPLAGWSDGSTKRVLVFNLVAMPGQTAVVAPPQFYRPGIGAVSLSDDHVSADSSPQLYVVEDLQDE